MQGKIINDNYPSFFWQTRKALCEEIVEAPTWDHIEKAADALIKVRREGKQMKQEADMLEAESCQGQKESKGE